MSIAAADSPFVSPPHCLPHGFFGCVMRNTLLQNHNDVSPDLLLNANRGLRGKVMLAAIDMRTKHDTVIGDLAQRGQAEHLKTSAIG